MKNSWNHLHPLQKVLFWPCPATFGKKLSEENSWNQLNNWKKIITPFNKIKQQSIMYTFYIYIINYIMCPFHLESSMWLVKRWTCDIEIVTSSVNEVHNDSTTPTVTSLERHKK
jgi:hypothetical protein